MPPNILPLILFAVLGGLSATTQAQAQAQPQPQPQPSVPPPPHAATEAACRDLLGTMPLTRPDSAGVEPLDANGCRFTNLEFGINSRFGYRVASLVEHGLPFGPLEPPSTVVDVRIEARDILFVLHTGNARVEWLSLQQQTPFDVVLDGRYDPATQELVLRELSLEGRAVGRTDLSATAGGVDASDVPARAGLRSFKLHMDSRRFIVAYALSGLVAVLPETDPAGAVDQMKLQGVALARTLLPQAGASPETVGAVAGFIADFPHPRHVLDVAVSSPVPVTLDALGQASGGPDALAALLKTLSVTASYAGDAR